jgi:hypothetical protein
MSNPLNSSAVSDPSFTLQPAARAAGPPNRATPRPVSPRPAGSRKRAASDGGPGDGIFGTWSTEYGTASAAGRAGSPHPSPLSSDGGPWTGSQQNLIPPAPPAFCRTQGQSRGTSRVGLRGGQTLATWIALVRQYEGPSRYPALAIRSPNRKAARVLLVCRLSRFVRMGCLLDSTKELGQRGHPPFRH